MAQRKAQRPVSVDCGDGKRDDSRWMDFEMSGRDEAALLRLLERLPNAERYEPDAYGVYGRCRPTSMRLGSMGW